MADLKWTSVASQDWFLAANWSLVGGGAGHVPGAGDNVLFDGSGYVLCWPTADIECNNLTLSATMTEMLLIEANATINGDFEIQAGYFGPTGGPDHIIEFKGNWIKTGGTFAVGTGPGRDPECIFSGAGKTYQLNDTGAAGYQNFTVIGNYTFSGTRLSLASISQELNISGTVIFAGTNSFILTGEWVGQTGDIIAISGFSPYVRYEVDSGVSMTTDPGMIGVRVEFMVQDDFVLPARTWDAMVYVDYEVDQKAFRLGDGTHHFNFGYKTFADNPAIVTSAELDWGDANFTCFGPWTVDRDSFTQPSQFIFKRGNGVHVFYDDFQLGVFGGNANMLMTGDDTIILRAAKARIYNYRLSRVVGGIPEVYDEQTWSKIYLLRTRADAANSIVFRESFICHDGRFELYNWANVSVRFRTWNLIPSKSTTFDKLTLIGIDGTKPNFGYPVTTGFAFHSRVVINDEANIFSVTICKWKCTPTVNIWNSEVWANDLGQSSGWNYYERDVRQIPEQRNILNERAKLTPTPAPELLIERLIEEIAA